MKQEYFEVVLEDINSKIDAIMEIVIPLAALPARLDRLESKVDMMAADIKVIKLVVGQHTEEIAELKRRTAHLA